MFNCFSLVFLVLKNFKIVFIMLAVGQFVNSKIRAYGYKIVTIWA